MNQRPSGYESAPYHDGPADTGPRCRRSVEVVAPSGRVDAVELRQVIEYPVLACERQFGGDRNSGHPPIRFVVLGTEAVVGADAPRSQVDVSLARRRLSCGGPARPVHVEVSRPDLGVVGPLDRVFLVVADAVARWVHSGEALAGGAEDRVEFGGALCRVARVEGHGSKHRAARRVLRRGRRGGTSVEVPAGRDDAVVEVVAVDGPVDEVA